MVEPYKGRVYDPCRGSGGMFVQSKKFVEAHGGQRHNLTLYGQELNSNTWRRCKMNLAIRGLEGKLGPQWADTFDKDLHPDLKADYILANPPFNISDWGGDKLQDDKRWKYGPPPPGKIVATDNGDATSHEPFQQLALHPERHLLRHALAD